MGSFDSEIEYWPRHASVIRPRHYIRLRLRLQGCLGAVRPVRQKVYAVSPPSRRRPERSAGSALRSLPLAEPNSNCQNALVPVPVPRGARPGLERSFQPDDKSL